MKVFATMRSRIKLVGGADHQCHRIEAVPGGEPYIRMKNHDEID